MGAEWPRLDLSRILPSDGPRAKIVNPPFRTQAFRTLHPRGHKSVPALLHTTEAWCAVQCPQNWHGPLFADPRRGFAHPFRPPPHHASPHYRLYRHRWLSYPAPSLQTSLGESACEREALMAEGVAFIGLGNIGNPMSGSLLKAGLSTGGLRRTSGGPIGWRHDGWCSPDHPPSWGGEMGPRPSRCGLSW
jgi:hypothetical protein